MELVHKTKLFITSLEIAIVYNRKQFFVKLNPDNISKYGVWNMYTKLNFFITSLAFPIVYKRKQFFVKLHPDNISKYICVVELVHITKFFHH